MKKDKKITPYPSVKELIDDIKGNIASKEDKDGVLKKDIDKVLKDYLKQAYEIRKVELDLYWKRATYFWGFLIATFTAYFIAMNDYYKFSYDNKLLVICIGFIFSLAWYLANRGSTYWITHWERIIDVIEEQLGTNFYKINLTPPKTSLYFGNYYPYSVSRINIIVSFFICLVWFLILVNFLGCFSCNNSTEITIETILILLLTTGVSIWLIFGTKSKKKSEYSFYKRKSTYTP